MPMPNQPTLTLGLYKLESMVLLKMFLLSFAAMSGQLSDIAEEKKHRHFL